MLVCPNGHSNTDGGQLCQECDAWLVSASTPTAPVYRRWWFAAASGAAAMLLIVGAIFAYLVPPDRSAVASRPTDEAAIQRWWAAGADKHVAALQDALESAQQSLQRMDKLGVEQACQRTHDAAVVDLQADLPSPDPSLTAQLTAAIADAHFTAHVCLSAISGSPNSYDIEFTTYLDQATKNLRAATEIVDKARLKA